MTETQAMQLSPILLALEGASEQSSRLHNCKAHLVATDGGGGH